MSQSNDDRINNAFSSEVKNTKDLFIDSYNYVIPPFQRYYTWSEENVSKLLDDLYLCINTNKLRNNATDYKSIICFLGTLIVVAYQLQDQPEFLNSNQGTEPATLYCVIDGQQRLTTVQLIGTILFERLEYLKNQLDLFAKSDYQSNNERAILEEVSSKITHSQKSLQTILTKNNEYTDEIKTPKLFRVPEDYYNMKNKKEEFTSVIGQYLWDFVDTYFNKKGNVNNTNKFKKSVFDNYKSKIQTNNDDDLQKDQWEHIEKVKENIETFINDYVFSATNIKGQQKSKQGKEFASFGLSCEQIVSLIRFNEIGSMRDYHLDDNVSIDEFTQILEKNNFLLQIALELVIFSKFFIENLAFTFVKAADENYAFSMFDSLNTSGELLTAYETFKAKYINTTENYNNSVYQKLFGEIDQYLNKSDKNKKKNATDNLIISFARETFGSLTIGKSLNSQRAFLYDLLEQCKNNSNNSPNKDDLLKELYIATIFWKNIWEHDFSNKTISFDITDFDSKRTERIHFSAFTSLCVALLVNAKHTIVSSVIIRGLSLCYKMIGSGEFKEALKSLEEIIKTCAVFSTIYRIAFGGTEGIDSIYKDLFKENTNKKINGISWFDPCVYSKSTIQLLKELCGGIKDRFKNALSEKNILTLEKWQNTGKSVPSYQKAKSFSIFVLLCYWSLCRYKQIDISNFSVDESLLDYLTINQDTTVEHIAPQNKKTDRTSTSWELDIYNEELSDNLGNLLILDRDVNSLINNGEPLLKLALYNFFKQCPQDRNVKQLIKENITVEKELEKLNLDSHSKIDQQALLVDFNETLLKHWTVKTINERFSVITEKVWTLFSNILELN